MSELSDLAPDLLRLHLEVAVWLTIQEIMRGQRALILPRDDLAESIARNGDAIIYRAPGRTAQAVTAVAEGLAMLAFCPGGAKFMGLRFEVPPEQARRVMEAHGYLEKTENEVASPAGEAESHPQEAKSILELAQGGECCPAEKANQDGEEVEKQIMTKIRLKMIDPSGAEPRILRDDTLEMAPEFAQMFIEQVEARLRDLPKDLVERVRIIKTISDDHGMSVFEAEVVYLPSRTPARLLLPPPPPVTPQRTFEELYRWEPPDIVEV